MTCCWQNLWNSLSDLKTKAQFIVFHHTEEAPKMRRSVWITKCNRACNFLIQLFFPKLKKSIQIIPFHITQCVADLSINCWNFFRSANQIHLKWNLAEDETTNWSNNEFGTEEEDHWKTAFLSSSPRLSLSEPYGFTF